MFNRRAAKAFSLACATILATFSAQSVAENPVRSSNPFKRIPAGVYRPLYPDAPTAGEKKQIAVPVSAFELQIYPTTNQMFRSFVEQQKRWRRSAIPALFADRTYLRSWTSDTEFSRDPESPVTDVSWFAAKAYCKWLGGRLPRSEEWEYVAQASETAFDGSEDDQYLERILRWYGRSEAVPHGTVGQWTNAYGISDMHGLVWEWVADFNTSMVTGESRSDGDTEKDMFCGGSAAFASEKQKRDYAAFMRFAFRSSLEGNYALPLLGFRCARDITPNHPVR